MVRGIGRNPRLRLGFVKGTAEALKTAELAYNEATQHHVPNTFYNEVVKIGRSIAQASGDGGAAAKWSQRGPR